MLSVADWKLYEKISLDLGTAGHEFIKCVKCDDWPFAFDPYDSEDYVECDQCSTQYCIKCKVINEDHNCKKF